MDDQNSHKVEDKHEEGTSQLSSHNFDSLQFDNLHIHDRDGQAVSRLLPAPLQVPDLEEQSQLSEDEDLADIDEKFKELNKLLASSPSFQADFKKAMKPFFPI